MKIMDNFEVLCRKYNNSLHKSKRKALIRQNKDK